jgi:preprotein translocase subunit SecA
VYNSIKRFFSKSRRELKRLRPIVEEFSEIYEPLHDLPDDELKAKTGEFLERLDQGETLDDIMLEAFAVVKEVCRRFTDREMEWDVAGTPKKWQMIPFDVQIMGAIVLHEGQVAEMATGEGKTLVATMPLYLNGLTHKGAHLVTVNDFLARRDANWMGPLYHWLGLSTAVLQDPQANNGTESLKVEWDEKLGYVMVPIPRREAYKCDIIYGRQDQFGFDYLYDNMAWEAEDIRQRGFYYAIVDEADQLLIDEARTPLIISGQAPVSKSSFYRDIKPLVEKLVKAQTKLVADLVNEAEKLYEDGKTYQAGVKLLQASRGAPKQRKLMQLKENADIVKLVTRVELDFIRDKRMPEIDENLLYVVEEKNHSADITEEGRTHLSPSQAERFLLPDISERIGKIERDETLEDADRRANIQTAYDEYGKVAERIHAMGNLLKAYGLYESNVSYVVQDDKVIIVDEFTGRLQPGRRFSDGLHQALEAKESVTVERDTMTVATITVQNYFRMYEKLAGMTGTAETEENELYSIYKLEVVVIPTNRPIRRLDMDDVIFRTRREKYNAIIDTVAELHEAREPVLVGTRSVEMSELLSRMLQRKGIKHSVLNAKHHQQEAEIIADAGQPGAVTIATNMAGRGQDIKIHPELIKCDECKLMMGHPGTAQTSGDLTINDCEEHPPCGLHIIGTERHDSRRIDRQLRGRSGRQGDPGASQFYLSLEDDLMRLFGSDRIASIMNRLGAEEGEVIQASMVTKAIDRAQQRVENNNFDIRKRLIDYDDVMNQQREVVYDRRRFALENEEMQEEIMNLVASVVDSFLLTHIDPEIPSDEWDYDGIQVKLATTFGIEADLTFEDGDVVTEDLVRERISEAVRVRYEERVEQLRHEAKLSGMEENELINRLQKIAILSTIDDAWREHLTDIEDLKGGIHLRSYGQKDPVVEFKREAYDMFEHMIDETDRQTLQVVYKALLPSEQEVEERRKEAARLQANHAEMDGFDGGEPMEFDKGPQIKTVGGRGARKPVTTRKARQQAPGAGGDAVVATAEKVSRNAPCPCGSGKKYKYCCGK